MNRFLAIAPLALLALSGCGEKGETPQIKVDGKAKIEKAPELFLIEARILERSKDRKQSLAAAARKLDELRDKLARLDGLESVEIEAEEVTARTVRQRGCDPEKDDTYDLKEYPENCEPLDYLASVDVSIEGEPAVTAGPAVSLLSELGVETAGSLSYKVKDPEATQDEARQAALAKAMRIARALAQKAGSEIRAPLEIEYSESSMDMIIVTGSRIAAHKPKIVPEVTLELPAEKVTFSAEVTVRFALRKPRADK